MVDESRDPEETVADTPADLAAGTLELFSRLRDESLGDEDRSACRDELVRLHLPLAERAARRFSNRGEPFDDLLQVGTIGLLGAIDRFDHERGLAFATFAVPTIVGEIKRYFRDKSWAIRVPRRLQELRLQVSTVSADLQEILERLAAVGEAPGGPLGQRQVELDQLVAARVAGLRVEALVAEPGEEQQRVRRRVVGVPRFVDHVSAARRPPAAWPAR